MKYDAVIFDLFGTLVDQPTFQGHLGSKFRRTMSDVADALSVGAPDLLRLWSETAYERDSGFFPTIEDYFQHLCRESGVVADARQLARTVELRLEYLTGALAPRNDAVATLTQLKASGHKIGLVSDCSSEVSSLWPATQFAPLLDAAVLSCDVGMTKPDPLIYQMVCGRLNVTPDRCLYVGDGGSKELTGASEAGMDAVLIRAPDDTVTGNREEWPGARISALKQVLDLVSRPDGSG